MAFRKWRNVGVKGAPRNPKRKNGQGTIYRGYIILSIDSKLIPEHRYLAEKALGKRLPRGAIVHHMNENGLDNHTPFNLVVCPNEHYHRLLHKRMKRLKWRLEWQS